MIQIKNFIDVKNKCKKLGCNLPTNLTILPRNFVSAESKDQLLNEGTATTVKVLLRNAGIKETPLEKTGEKINGIVEEGFDWIGPTLFLSSALLMQNQLLIDLALGVIANYLTDFFKGIPDEKKNVKLNVVIETKTGNHKEVKYEGPVEGLKEVPKVVRSLHDEK